MKNDITSSSYVTMISDQVAQIAASALGQIREPQALAALALAIYDFCDGLTQDLMQREPPPQPVQCEAGCWYCCVSNTIEALPLEVLSIAHVMRQADLKLPKAEVREDGGRVCPLLNKESCAVYPARLFVCRGFNAYDPQACKAKKLDGADAKILGYAHQGLVQQAALNGLAQACRTAQLDTALTDLPGALEIALQDLDGVTERWLAGETVFAPVRSA